MLRIDGKLAIGYTHTEKKTSCCLRKQIGIVSKNCIWRPRFVKYNLLTISIFTQPSPRVARRKDI